MTNCFSIPKNKSNRNLFGFYPIKKKIEGYSIAKDKDEVMILTAARFQMALKSQIIIKQKIALIP